MIKIFGSVSLVFDTRIALGHVRQDEMSSLGPLNIFGMDLRGFQQRFVNCGTSNTLSISPSNPFALGFTAGQILDMKSYDSEEPTVLQCLVYHVASSMGLAPGSKLPQVCIGAPINLHLMPRL